MELQNPLLIVVDAGHGGHDFGATFGERKEKDDNLNLALALRQALLRQGVDTLMTRDSDVFISLAERAEMANKADADLFIALHRNSYTEHTPSSNGIENIIYLTAPEATSGRAASLVQNNMVNVAGQTDRGVTRGNYYVLRRTKMPSMLLETGFIIDEKDNALYDKHLNDYAEAIAKGVTEYFGIPYVPPQTTVSNDFSQPAVAVFLPQTNPMPAPAPMPLNQPLPIPENMPVPGFEMPAPVPMEQSVPNLETPLAQPAKKLTRTEMISDAQRVLNAFFGGRFKVNGQKSPQLIQFLIKKLQNQLNRSFNANIVQNGIMDRRCRSAMPTLKIGDNGNLVLLTQIALALKGYNTGNLDGVFGIITKAAIEMFAKDNNLIPDGMASPDTLYRLFS